MMSLTDYYNAQADANLMQAMGSGPAYQGRVYDANEVDRDFLNIKAKWFYDKQLLVRELYLKEALEETIKQFLQEHHPESWQRKWAEINEDAHLYALPLIEKDVLELEQMFGPEVANHPEAYLEPLPMPPSADEMEFDNE
jgi:hypothetical protein